jgi:Flp pilus assembly protein TadG
MSVDKNIFVTSHNQMGGITANTVNFGPTARSMNDQLGSQIKENIPTNAKVTVTAVLGDGEAFGFANQILAWMKANGYDSVEGVNQAVYTNPVMGQNLNKKSDDEFELIIGTRQ